eukprot:g8605.t1
MKATSAQADGINLHGNIKGALVHDVYIENTGDDTLALWGAESFPEQITFANAVAVNPGIMRPNWYGNCVATYGLRSVIFANITCEAPTLEQPIPQPGARLRLSRSPPKRFALSNVPPMAEEAPSKSLMEAEAAHYGATYAAKVGGNWWKCSYLWRWSLPTLTLSPPLLAEGLGTFCLVLTVGCVVIGPAPVPWAPTAIAAVLMVMVYATGPISGGNLNPAVSLALAISGKLPWLQMLKYWAVQLLGGFLGATAARYICAPNYVLVAPLRPFGAGSCFTAELLYTFMLCFVVLNCTASRRNNPKDDPNQFGGLAIGFVLVAGGHAVGGVSGAALNPALALSDATDEGLQTHEPGLWVSSAAEMLGTFMLVFTVGMNLVCKSPSMAFSAAAALMCMIYSVGNISGAHLNPAVTLAVLLRGKCGRRQALCYAVAQLLGGLLAGLGVAAFHGVSFTARKSIQLPGPNSLGAGIWGAALVLWGRCHPLRLTMGKHYSIWQASFAELFFTTILAYVALAVATRDVPAESKTKQNFYFGLAIGSCLTVGGCAAGSISGGELNPAVSLGRAPSGLRRGWSNVATHIIQ